MSNACRPIDPVLPSKAIRLGNVVMRLNLQGTRVCLPFYYWQTQDLPLRPDYSMDAPTPYLTSPQMHS